MKSSASRGTTARRAAPAARRALLGDQHDLGGGERQQLVQRPVGRVVEDDDQRRAARLVEQPARALAPVRVGRDRLQHAASGAAQRARHGGGELPGRSDDECVHAPKDSSGAGPIPPRARFARWPTACSPPTRRSGARRTRWACSTPTSASSSRRPTLGARLWRLAPGQASTRHRHAAQEELYVVLEGTGRMRVGERAADARPAVGRAGRAGRRPAGLQRHGRRRAVARRRRAARGGEHARDDAPSSSRASTRTGRRRCRPSSPEAGQSGSASRAPAQRPSPPWIASSKSEPRPAGTGVSVGLQSWFIIRSRSVEVWQPTCAVDIRERPGRQEAAARIDLRDGGE